MEILNLFTSGGTASTLINLSLVGILGILLGKIKIISIKLGIAGVLFSGLLIGHLGADFDHKVLHFVKEFGLILFVYSIGLDVGPRFLSSLKNNGLRINILASTIVFLGFFTALGLKFIFDIPVEVITGIMCGAVTNTPSLGAAQQVISEQMINGETAASVTGMAYAVAYPFGIFGIILSMLALKFYHKIQVNKEVDDYNIQNSKLEGKPLAVNIKVENPNLFGKDIDFLKKTLSNEFVFSRLKRNGEFLLPSMDLKIQEFDIVYGVSSEQFFDTLQLNVGDLYQTEKLEISGKLAVKHILVTNKEFCGQTLHQIGISRRFPANITRIYRAGTEFMSTEENTIEFGDTIRVVGEKSALPKVADLLGNSVKELSHPNILPLLMGILAGILIGSIPLALPGLPAPAKLGLAGGPLLIALILGHKGRIGKLDFYMTPSANLFIRELGIVLFLACVGLSSGKHFIETIVNGGYIWMLYGTVITFVPLIIVGFIARYMKLNYLTICGFLSGSMTDPPALEFANSLAPVQAQATSYATVYPLVMFLRVLLAQILVLQLI